MAIEMSSVQTIGLAVLMLLVGRKIKQHVQFFRTFAIPEAVIGGFLFAIFNFIMTYNGVWEIKFDTSLQSYWMIIFFTSVAFNASLVTLKKGGKLIVKFLIVATVLCILQNFLCLLFVKAGWVDIDPRLALMCGSTPMTGGHGTSGGIAPMVEENGGITGAKAVAFAAATYGLIAGSLMGGPVARGLIERKGLLAKEQEAGKKEENLDMSLLEEDNTMTSQGFLDAFIILLLTMGIGSLINIPLNKLVGKATDLASFPAYMGPMILGIFIRLQSDKTTDWLPNAEIQAAGNVGLNLFLAIALMTLNLMDLVSLAKPMLILLLGQTVLTYVYARFVTFPVMGGDYDAAVLAAGHCGFGMGATPNGVANMQSVCEKYHYSEVAFFVVPIVGGMFIDFANLATIVWALTIAAGMVI